MCHVRASSRLRDQVVRRDLPIGTFRDSSVTVFEGRSSDLSLGSRRNVRVHSELSGMKGCVDLNHRSLRRSLDRTSRRSTGARALGAVSLAAMLTLTGGEVALAQPTTTTTPAAATTTPSAAASTTTHTTTTQSVPQVRSEDTRQEGVAELSPQGNDRTSEATTPEPTPARASSTQPPSTTAEMPSSALATTPAAEQARPGNGKKIPYTGKATENPNATVVPGKMRSDREEIPEGFTKADADKAETLEAKAKDPKNARSAFGILACQYFWPSPHAVCGAILDKYLSLGGSNSFLKHPINVELGNPDGAGRRQEFLVGPIYWHPTHGAHPVVNSFMTKWGSKGWEGGVLGYPTTDEAVNPDGVGRRQNFVGAAIYWHPLAAPQAAFVGGAIRDKWGQTGWEGPGGLLGYPTTDETVVGPGGNGRMNRFERGAIYWSPTTGAHPVSGTIWSRWSSLGYESGTYGYPIADAVQTDGIWHQQQFQNGSLKGTIVINRDLYSPITSAAGTTQVTATQAEDEEGENYESRLLPCINYLIPEEKPLARFKVRDNNGIEVQLTCGRFRGHMAPNPAVGGDPGHFDNYPPTRSDWYNFLACTFYTLNAEDYEESMGPGRWGRQRGNTASGVKSVSIVVGSTSTFDTGWAGSNEYSSQWSGCTQGLTVLWQ